MWAKPFAGGARRLRLGPIVTTVPSVSPGAPATVGVTQTRTQGVYAARGGGSVAVVREWLLDGAQVSTAATFAPTGAQLGQALLYRERATETGGTAPGVTTRTVVVGLVAAVAATAPAAFTAGMWALSDPATDGDLTVTVTGLPGSGGAAITALERAIGNGSYAPLGGTTTGTYTISGLSNDASASVKIRAVNAVGNGPDGDTKVATPTASLRQLIEALDTTAGRTSTAALTTLSSSALPAGMTFISTGRYRVSGGVCNMADYRVVNALIEVRSGGVLNVSQCRVELDNSFAFFIPFDVGVGCEFSMDRTTCVGPSRYSTIATVITCARSDNTPAATYGFVRACTNNHFSGFANDCVKVYGSGPDYRTNISRNYFGPGGFREGLTPPGAGGSHPDHVHIAGCVGLGVDVVENFAQSVVPVGGEGPGSTNGGNNFSRINPDLAAPLLPFTGTIVIQRNSIDYAAQLSIPHQSAVGLGVNPAGIAFVDNWVRPSSAGHWVYTPGDDTDIDGNTHWDTGAALRAIMPRAKLVYQADSGASGAAVGNVLASGISTDGDGPIAGIVVREVNGATGNVGQPVAMTNGGTVTIAANGAVTFSATGALELLGEGEIADTTIGYRVGDGAGGDADVSSTLTIRVTGVAAALPIVSTVGGSMRFPDSNTRYHGQNDPRGVRCVRTPSFAAAIFGGTEGAFLASVEVNWLGMGRGVSHKILGNAAAGTLGGTIEIGAIAPTTLTGFGQIFFRLRGSQNITATISSGGHNRLLLVMRKAGVAGAARLFQVYAEGVLVSQALVDATGEGALGLRAAGFLIGANANGSQTTVHMQTGAGGVAFSGAIGLVGYIDQDVTQAECEAISAGVAPLAAAPAKAGSWVFLRQLPTLTAVPSSGDALATATEVTFLGLGGQASIAEPFAPGSDIFAARGAGAESLSANYVTPGRVWSVRPGATSGLVTLSGKAAGLSGAIEARLMNADGQTTTPWTTLAGSTIAGGAWSGTMMAPRNTGWGYAEVRHAASGLVHRARTRCGVGYVVAIMGQSDLEWPVVKVGDVHLPDVGVAAAATWQAGRNTTASGTAVGSGRMVSAVLGRGDAGVRPDGMCGAANHMATMTTAPVHFVGMCQEGSGSQQLVDDTETRRAWSELVLARDTAGAQPTTLVWWWIAAMQGLAAPNGDNFRRNVTDPLFYGVNPGDLPYQLTHHIFDGVDLPLDMKVGALTWVRGGDGTVEQDFSPTAAFLTYQGFERTIKEHYGPVRGWAVGPHATTVMTDTNGAHSSIVDPRGTARLGIYLAECAARSLGLSTRTDPAITGAAINAGRTAITVTVARPNGGVIQTAWALKGRTPPAGLTTVQGFEVQNGGVGAFTRASASAAAAVKFTAEVTDAAAGLVTLTKVEGAWAPGTKVRYGAGGGVASYGLPAEASQLFDGALFESGPVEGGLGLPVEGNFTATLA